MTYILVKGPLTKFVLGYNPVEEKDLGDSCDQKLDPGELESNAMKEGEAEREREGEREMEMEMEMGRRSPGHWEDQPGSKIQYPKGDEE